MLGVAQGWAKNTTDREKGDRFYAPFALVRTWWDKSYEHCRRQPLRLLQVSEGHNFSSQAKKLFGRKQVNQGRIIALLCSDSRANLYALCWVLTSSALNKSGWPCIASLVPLEATSKLVRERPSRKERATPTISAGSAGCPVEHVSPWRNIASLHPGRFFVEF